MRGGDATMNGHRVFDRIYSLLYSRLLDSFRQGSDVSATVERLLHAFHSGIIHPR